MVAKILLLTLVLRVGTFSRADEAAELHHHRLFMERSEDMGRPTNCNYLRKELSLNETEFGEFPWKVSILPSNEPNSSQFQHCDRSLIHSKIVLTDARCVYKKSATDIKVRAGEVQTNSTQVRLVKEIIVHESFNDRNLHNNLALLFLESRFDCNSYVLSACIPLQYPSSDNLPCYGLGLSSDPNVVRNMELAVVPRDVCQDSLRRTYLGDSFDLHKTFLCAGSGDRNTCTRDYGSSLMCETSEFVGKSTQLVGIKAWNIECGVNDVPDLYTSLVELHPWIYRNLRLNYITLPASC